MENKITIALRLIMELNIPNVNFAFVGGSVGRRDDDEWSDIDLTICVNDQKYHCNKNLVFEGEMVQLFITHPFEWEAVEQNPLEYRFLLESLSVYDPNFIFSSLKEELGTYLHSALGKQRIYTDWINLVSHHQGWAREKTLEGKMYSATISAGAAFVDAAFMHLYFNQNCLATGELIPFLKNNYQGFEEYITICHWLANTEDNVTSAIRTVEHYREYFRNKTPNDWNIFDLSPIQDVLMSNKAKRLIQSQQFTNLKWQFAGEAFGLFLSASQGQQALEDHLISLPTQLQTELRKLGFVALSVKEAERLIVLSEELISLVPLQLS